MLLYMLYMIQDLREVFEMEAKQTGRRRLLLTMAAAGGSHFINVAYERHKIIEYVLLRVYLSPVHTGDCSPRFRQQCRIRRL